MAEAIPHRWPIGCRVLATDLLAHGVERFLAMRMDTLQPSYGDALQVSDGAIADLRHVLRALPAQTASVGWSGPAVWNFSEGPTTLGLGNAETRTERLRGWMRALEINAELQIPLLQTHFGFVPEEPQSPLYAMYVDALRRLARRGASLGVTFCLETGQETPVTLRRLLVDCGETNVGANLDTANLLMYGKGNPTDAVDVLGGWIRSLHIKDGDYPLQDSYTLGLEFQVGKGRVDFPAVFAKLRAHAFQGPLIIEREISGP
ncbi:MAG: sugar phosphate isomerase/epimerase family protein, partial [Clostridia bacterium]